MNTKRSPLVLLVNKFVLLKRPIIVMYEDSVNDLSNIIYETELSFPKEFIKQLFQFSPIPDNLMHNTHSYCHWLCTACTIIYSVQHTLYKISFHSRQKLCEFFKMCVFSTTVHLLIFQERAAHKVKTFEFGGKSLKIEVCTTIFLLLPPNSDVNRSRILLPTIAFNPTILPAKSIPKKQPQSCNQCVLILTAG